MQSSQENDPTLKGLLRIFSRRRTTLLWTAGIVFLLSILACVSATRRYTASSKIQLEKSSSGGLDLESMMGAASSGASDSLSVNLDLQTQSDILQSEELELKVVKDLHLLQNEDFQPRFSILGSLISLVTPKGPQDPTSADIEDSPALRAHALQVFSGNLKVKVVAGTRLLEVSYTNQDPKVAANIVNHLVQALVDYTFQTKFKAANQASAWLEGQLGGLRKQSEDLQSKVVALQRETGLFGVGGSDLQGKPAIYSPDLDRLQQSTAELSQSEANRILKGAVYEVIKTGNAELISQLSGTSLGVGTSQGVQSSLTLIQTLRAQESTLQAQVEQDAAAFGSAYPKMIQERASLRRIQQLLQDEIARIAARAKNDYVIAERAASGTRANYEKQRKKAEKINDKTITYSILEKEATQSQDLYQGLLRHLKEAGILEGLHSSNITVVYIARPPARPSTPNTRIYLVLGLGLGLFLGGATVLFVDAVDNKLQGVEEIEKMGIPLLGVLPRFKPAIGSYKIQVSAEPSSIFTENVRALRSVLLISRSETPPRVILVTSASPAEGKSTVSLNLAAAFAQQNKRVLLIEADLRRPVFRERLNVEKTTGLSTLLANPVEFSDAFSSEDQPNLYLMPAGPTPPFPAELLAAPRMAELLQEMKKRFDFVVIDSPPIIPVSDARSLTALADASILVVRAGRTSRAALHRAYEILVRHAKEHAVPAIGVVLNDISLNSSDYYHYYGYNSTAYYGQGGVK